SSLSGNLGMIPLKFWQSRLPSWSKQSYHSLSTNPPRRSYPPSFSAIFLAIARLLLLSITVWYALANLSAELTLTKIWDSPAGKSRDATIAIVDSAIRRFPLDGQFYLVRHELTEMMK
ncbi:MAG TPA: hypothetical protein VJQ25_11455, partial [Nitrospira sp.]|nr:hypothetical protein [Nitrospira sp.]